MKYQQCYRILMHLYRLGTNLQILTQKKYGSTVCIHSPKAIFTSSLSWTSEPPKCCFSGPKIRFATRHNLSAQQCKPTHSTLDTSCCRRFTGIFWTIDPHCSDCGSNIWDVADSTITGKWKWLFMDGCGYRSLITTARRFVNSCKDGTNASMCSGMMSKTMTLK